MHDIFLDFELQTDPLTPPKRLDLVLINKKKTFYLEDFSSGGFFRSSELLSKNKRDQKYRQIFESCQRTEKNKKKTWRWRCYQI